MASTVPVSSRHRVPAEHRFLGLDRRTFKYAAPAVVVYLLWAWIVPWVDSQVAWEDQTSTGDVIQIADEVTMTPQPGWGLISGLRTSDRTRSGELAADETVLVKDGVLFLVQQGPFDGSTRTLLRQIERINSTTADKGGFSVVGGPRPIATDSGLKGIAEGYQSQRNIGVTAAFVAGDTGIRVQVVGAPEAMTQQADDVEAMIQSITYPPEDAR
ncbi:hypothetical protein [Mumia sp. Pv 4-285]|uniref:hypothetical protein n=1 Tax=Mumia qirimensis TaxID=3234852 RepID=UPI00351D32C4